MDRLEKGKLPATQLFKTGDALVLYSKWDDNGVPTHSIDGEELSKSRRKKMAKEVEMQEKLHLDYLASCVEKKA